MSIRSAISRLWKRDAVHYVIANIPPERQDVAVNPVTMVAEQHYFRLWLSEMFLKEDGRLFRNYVPVVHSVVTMQFAGKPAQELPYVAGPQNLGLDTTLGKGIQVNHALTNLLPFRGGNVSVGCALAAYKERDFLQGFMTVLSDVSGLLNVGQLSATLKVVDAALGGVQELLAGGDKDIHLLFYGGFGGTDPDGGAGLKSGYTAIVKAKASTFDSKKLFIKEKQLHFGDALGSAKPLEGYDYMLLRLEAATGRDDFLSFDTFARLLQEAIKEGHKDRKAGDEIIKTISVIVWESPDLTNADRIAVAKAIKGEYAKALGEGDETKPSRPDAVDRKKDSAEDDDDPFVVRASSLSSAIRRNQPKAAEIAGTDARRFSLQEFLTKIQ